MSLYSMTMGDGQERNRGLALLALLGEPDIGRYRDAWVERGADGEPVIAIYTRNGGGNRECWCDDGDHAKYGPCTAAITEAIPSHPLYLRDEDDEFDSTYATFYFKAPEEHREALRGIAGEPVDMSARWQSLIAALNAGGDQ